MPRKREDESYEAHLSTPNNDFYKKAQRALEDAALGTSDSAQRTLSIAEDRGNGNTRTVTQKYGPNVELLQEMLKEKIGGPQDWC